MSTKWRLAVIVPGALVLTLSAAGVAFAAPAQASGLFGLSQQSASIVYIIVLFAILYFLMIRPQQSRQKKHQEMVRKLSVNDEIITIGGIYGTVVKLKEKSVIVRVADNVRMEFTKSAVSQITGSKEPEKE
jgi:preprotein translocase subunit YajC